MGTTAIELFTFFYELKEIRTAFGLQKPLRLEEAALTSTIEKRCQELE